MCACHHSQAAMLWCISVQECAMCVLWPASCLQDWPEEYGAGGQLLFRGPRWAVGRRAASSPRQCGDPTAQIISPFIHPAMFSLFRLKMGVCEGSPRSILPDHMGRADYHGASINQAARFMDAGENGQGDCYEAPFSVVGCAPPLSLTTLLFHAAAHGGQVTCEKFLADRILSDWSASAQCDAGHDQVASPCASGQAEVSICRLGMFRYVIYVHMIDPPTLQSCDAFPEIAVSYQVQRVK